MLGSLGVAVANPLGPEPAARACLLLPDGLGWELPQAHQEAAPFLNSPPGESPNGGEHGLVGYTMALPGYDRAFNTPTWSLYGLGRRVDLRHRPRPAVPPRRVAGGDSGVAAAHGRVGIVQRGVDPAQARLNGHHGSLTLAEQLVPLPVYRSGAASESDPRGGGRSRAPRAAAPQSASRGPPPQQGPPCRHYPFPQPGPG